MAEGKGEPYSFIAISDCSDSWSLANDSRPLWYVGIGYEVDYFLDQASKLEIEIGEGGKLGFGENVWN